MGLLDDLFRKLFATFLTEIRSTILAPEHLVQLQLLVNTDDLEVTGRCGKGSAGTHFFLVCFHQLVMGHMTLATDDLILIPK